MSKKSKKSRAKEQEASPTEAMRKVIQNTVNEVRRKVAVSRPPAELSPPANINQRCTMTPMENKMDKVKTETYKGNTYQVGKDYLFSDFNVVWVHSQLTGLASNNSSPFKAGDFSFQFIKEVPASENIGTITPAPVPLIHGKAYTFDCDNHSDVIGLFSKGGGLFLIHDGAVFNACFCTNIRPMAVIASGKTDE
jgi:hypothetical protein